jgi:hypothetical protein
LGDERTPQGFAPVLPGVEQVRLMDFKVSVIEGKEAASAKVRVLIESIGGRKAGVPWDLR